LKVGIQRNPNQTICLGCIPNEGICLGLTQNLEKYLMKMTKSGSKRKIQEISYKKHSITTKQETSIREERKENNSIIP
jgi:hypothetical protein